MGIAFTAKIIDENNDLVAQFYLSNYRAFRCFLNEEDDCAGNKEMGVEETLAILQEVKDTFTQHGYFQAHHGPTTCAFFEKYLQTFSPDKVILEWG